MTNCYWIEELGAFEVCADDVFNFGWTQFDSIPDDLGGLRDTFTGLGDSPTNVKPAYGNGTIVIAVKYDLGDSGGNTSFTTGVFTSSDGGFTYGPFIDKFPWLAGTYPGYSATVNYYGFDDCEHWGTRISFDGANFYVVETSFHNQGNPYRPIMYTSKSTDGVNWTRQVSNCDYNYPIGSDSYLGDLWVHGSNTEPWSEGIDPDSAHNTFHSDDDGVSWTKTTLQGPDVGSIPNWSWPAEVYRSSSANALGFHILADWVPETLWPTYGMYYYRPTSKTTYAAPQLLFNYNTTAYFEKSPQIIASRVTPLNIYCLNFSRQTFYEIVFRRSIDGGVNWSPQAVIHVDVAYQFDEYYAGNIGRMVELPDGRIVVIYVLLIDAVTESIRVDYIVSNDGGATFSLPTTVSDTELLNYFTPVNDDEYQFDYRTYNPRIEATAMGNSSVLVAVTDSNGQSNSFIFSVE